MKRPAVLIVGAVAGALLVAGIGASAHTVSFLTRSSQQGATIGDESSGARTEPSESPEPSETPTTEPTETPEAADTENDTDSDTETNDEQTTAETPDQEVSGGGEEHGD